MPRPKPNLVTFTIDGREVTAAENSMLVDGAKNGDVEIPVFCYEPKLGQPVGACRMCLVEIEGIPKLQTACSTPIKDGMVVHTQTDRVHEAQKSVVEFLLINHPLDCPVCDKGGECPLQDITYGWGPGTSRFIEPKRHFKKPLELSPLIAIDRERCILCYRCVRFSQEISEDYQLILKDRGTHSFVATFDSRPYLAPFSGNIIELCPVGALTSTAYRFRARPWDVEGAGSICTLCPAQCNIEFTVRDDRVMRVMARDHEGVDDGWLCDKGRFGYQHVHSDQRITQPLIREGGELRPASWERALSTATNALTQSEGKIAAIAGGDTTNEEAFLLRRVLTERLDSKALMSAGQASLSPTTRQALAQSDLAATVSDLEFAHTVLLLECDPIDEVPVWDLRIRKGVRRNNANVLTATSRPGGLDPCADGVFRLKAGLAPFLISLDGVIAGDQQDEGQLGEFARQLRDGGEDIVLVYSERALATPEGETIAQAILNIASRLGLNHSGAGLLEIPSSPNGRGLREVGFTSTLNPGYVDTDESPIGVSQSLKNGELTTLHLLHADPPRDESDPELWRAALAKATNVICHESFMTDTVERYATVVFPAETYAEKDGTVVHPDGRVQRLRPAIGRPQGPDGPSSGVRPAWQVISELAQRLGIDLEILTASMASKQLFETNPLYKGLTLDEIGGRGIRWQERPASPNPADKWHAQKLEIPSTSASDGIRLGTYRPLWASKEVEHSPALAFTNIGQLIELGPVDADRLELSNDDIARLRVDGTTVEGRIRIRAAIEPGRVFAASGLGTNAVPESYSGTSVTLERIGDAGTVPRQ